MNDRWEDRDRSWRGDRDRGPLAFGIVLILIGIAAVISQVAGVNWGEAGWPLFIIVPGVALLVLGFAIGGEGGLGAAIPGGIITTVGLLLAFQDATGTYASWAYAWALVAPGSVGVVMLVYGLLHGRRDLISAGARTAGVGLALFVAFGLFFENVIGIDRETGTTVMRDAMPYLAVIVGILIVIANLIPAPPRERDRAWSSSDQWSTPQGSAEPPASSSEPPTPPAS